MTPAPSEAIGIPAAVLRDRGSCAIIIVGPAPLHVWDSDALLRAERCTDRLRLVGTEVGTAAVVVDLQAECDLRSASRLSLLQADRGGLTLLADRLGIHWPPAPLRTPPRHR